jgi:hypothetical protein
MFPFFPHGGRLTFLLIEEEPRNRKGARQGKGKAGSAVAESALKNDKKDHCRIRFII